MKDALLKKTKAQLLELIKIHGDVSVDEATERLGLAKTTARQHLLLLEQQGLIRRGSRKQPRGRHQLSYQLSESGARLFPTREPQLLGALLAHLIEGGKKDWVNQFFRHYWDQRIQRFRDRLSSAGKKAPSARRVLFEMLEEEGFMPELVKRGGALLVRECNCPFAEAVKVSHIPCRMEAEFLAEALGAKVERISYIPAGDTSCTYRVAIR